MKSLTNFECHVIDEDVLISFESSRIKLSLSEAESLQHRLARHVFYGEGGFDLGGLEIEMDEAFVLNEVLQFAFEEGYGVAFGEGDEEEE